MSTWLYAILNNLGLWIGYLSNTQCYELIIIQSIPLKSFAKYYIYYIIIHIYIYIYLIYRRIFPLKCKWRDMCDLFIDPWHKKGSDKHAQKIHNAICAYTHAHTLNLPSNMKVKYSYCAAGSIWVDGLCHDSLTSQTIAVFSEKPGGTSSTIEMRMMENLSWWSHFKYWYRWIVLQYCILQSKLHPSVYPGSLHIICILIWRKIHLS